MISLKLVKTAVVKISLLVCHFYRKIRYRMQEKIPLDSKKVASFCVTRTFRHKNLDLAQILLKSPIKWMHFKSGFNAKNVLYEF